MKTRFCQHISNKQFNAKQPKFVTMLQLFACGVNFLFHFSRPRS